MPRQIYFFIFLLFLSFRIDAVVLDDLYQAEIPVPDQSDSSQKAAMSKALLQVLVKLTGDRNIQGRPVAGHLLQNPEKYLQQYRFRNKPVIEDNQLTLNQQLNLWVSFNESALEKVLRDYAVPVWGKVRPSTLVWLSMENAGERKFIGLEDETGFTGSMEKTARSRGIVLNYPLFDPADQNALNVADIRSGFTDVILQASERYPADAILTGHLTRTGENNWHAEWSSHIAENIDSWSNKGNVQSVLAEGINHLADNLASRYIQTSVFAQVTGIEIVVNDIDTFEQYSRVLKYLNTLNSVTRVDVQLLKPGQATFLITSSGGELAVQRAIELGNILKSMATDGSAYRLVQR